jgi:hypothetical protein
LQTFFLKGLLFFVFSLVMWSAPSFGLHFSWHPFFFWAGPFFALWFIHDIYKKKPAWVSISSENPGETFALWKNASFYNPRLSQSPTNKPVVVRVLETTPNPLSFPGRLLNCKNLAGSYVIRDMSSLLSCPFDVPFVSLNLCLRAFTILTSQALLSARGTLQWNVGGIGKSHWLSHKVAFLWVCANAHWMCVFCHSFVPHPKFK